VSGFVASLRPRIRRSPHSLAWLPRAPALWTSEDLRHSLLAPRVNPTGARRARRLGLAPTLHRRPRALGQLSVRFGFGAPLLSSGLDSGRPCDREHRISCVYALRFVDVRPHLERLRSATLVAIDLLGSPHFERNEPPIDRRPAPRLALVGRQVGRIRGPFPERRDHGPDYPALTNVRHGCRRAEPKRLRYRLLHVSGRLAFSGRGAKLHLQYAWPWVTELLAAFTNRKAFQQRGHLRGNVAPPSRPPPTSFSPHTTAQPPAPAKLTRLLHVLG